MVVDTRKMPIQGYGKSQTQSYDNSVHFRSVFTSPATYSFSP